MPPTRQPPEARVPYEMPYRGQMMILVSGHGQQRDYTVGHVTSLVVRAFFNKETGQPTGEVENWSATIQFGTMQRVVKSKGDTYLPSSGDWHPPSAEELTWPGVSAPKETSSSAIETKEPVVEAAPKAPAAPGPRPRGAQPNPPA